MTDRSMGRRLAPAQGLKLALLSALLVVPLAGAAEPPLGWSVAAVTALAILGVARSSGARAPWGWLALLSALAAIVVPRGQFAVVGPALLVATVLSGVLWLANHGSGERGRPRPGSRERAAQQHMGFSGERQVGDVLARELPEDYVLINGLKLPRGAGDIDHLVVGPSGVFVLETKTMAGRIVCEPDGTWRRTRVGRAGTAYAAFIGDPAAQVQRNIFAVRDCLRKRLPGLFRRTPLWIDGLVVFPHPKTELLTNDSRVPALHLEQAAPRICQHGPPRTLLPRDVQDVVDALLVEGQQPQPALAGRAQRAQALVEAALALPVVVALLLATVALNRIVQAHAAVVAIAHAAARAGALAASPDDAVERIRQRADLVAPGVGLNPHLVRLDWDVSAFSRDPGRVSVVAHYEVGLGDLALAGWAPAFTVRAEHAEWIDPFRGGLRQVEGSG
jgi:Nuclease-related domain